MLIKVKMIHFSINFPQAYLPFEITTLNASHLKLRGRFAIEGNKQDLGKKFIKFVISFPTFKNLLLAS